MKSAYELAMERLNREAPQAPLSEDQKAEIVETSEKYEAKIAEREVFLGSLIAKAQASGNLGEAAELETQLGREVAKFRSRCEEEKEAIRNRTEGEGGEEK